jgi:hypothetical protein
VETLAWPSHSWTLAISASCEYIIVVGKGFAAPSHFPLVITSDRAAEYAFRFNRRKSLHLEQPMFDAFIGRITKQAAAA